MPVTTPRDGVAINYESHGEGPPLLLISGTGHDLGFWSGQLPFFAPEYRAIVFDNRGVGGSSVPPSGYSLADMADDAAHVLDEAGIDIAHVMGFSMGGHIAQELALNHPDRTIVRARGAANAYLRAGDPQVTARRLDVVGMNPTTPVRRQMNAVPVAFVTGHDHRRVSRKGAEREVVQ